VASLNDLVRARTALGEAELDLLHRLVGAWQLLADLSFADLLLWVPSEGSEGPGYVAVAQIRPTTGPTAFPDDLVGTWLPRGRRPQLDTALDEGRICRERDPEWRADVPVREETIPVRTPGGDVVAVVSRHTNLAAARTPSRLELTYLQAAGDLARMLAEGRFPGEELQRSGDGPRTGDGLVRLDPAGVVTYASPNAESAFRRLGLTADLVGRHLGRTVAELAPQMRASHDAVPRRLAGTEPAETELETSAGAIRLRTIPLTPDGVHGGALVLCQDVTELRRRERELITKDATIREIHHRVKNNLQTVAALLRLQSRRLEEPSARAALDEAVRRVGSIAVVHETLALAPDERVDFDEIAGRVLAMVGELATAHTPVRVARSGRFGILPAEVATPLVLVLTELVQNAAEHGLAGAGGEVTVEAGRTEPAGPGDAAQTGGAAGTGGVDPVGGVAGATGAGGPAATGGPAGATGAGDVTDAAGADGVLRLAVVDRGIGLPAGFDAATDGGLGLQIVRTLVEQELGGRLRLRSADPGVRAEVEVPLRADA
jgi:two-component sensor histidine kinase